MRRDWTWKRLETEPSHSPDIGPRSLRLNRKGWLVRHQKPKPTRCALVRFLKKIVVSDLYSWNGSPCWDWHGHINKQTGYGQIKNAENKTVNAHSFAYNEFVGKVGAGEELTQGCDRRQCCSPFHISTIARSENEKRCKSRIGER